MLIVKTIIVKYAVICMLSVFSATNNAIGDENDPALSPLPNLEDLRANTKRGIYVEASVSADGAVQLLEAGVTKVPPGATDDDPQMLLIEMLDVDGRLLATQNVWDPRYEYQRDENGEEVVVLEQGTGLFMVPFDHRIAVLKFTDQQIYPPQLLANLDVHLIVQAFCVGDLENDNCIDFIPSDMDGDGVIDVEDVCANTEPNTEVGDDGCPLILDSDGDGVIDDEDLCPNTNLPEPVPYSGELGKNRWVLRRTDGVFDQAEPQSRSKYSFTIEDTSGCSCEQIAIEQNLGIGMLEKGCSTSVMLNWIAQFGG